jgi:hypothetical protein
MMNAPSWNYDGQNVLELLTAAFKRNRHWLPFRASLIQAIVVTYDLSPLKKLLLVMFRLPLIVSSISFLNLK